MLARILLLKIPFYEGKGRRAGQCVLKLSKMGKFGKMVNRPEQIVTKQKNGFLKKDVCESCESYGMQKKELNGIRI